MTTRRNFLMAAGALAGGGLLGATSRARSGAKVPTALENEFKRIERDSGGRLGVAVRDTQSGLGAGWRADDRFPMCSTFKLLAASAVLQRVDTGRERLDRRVRFAAGDVVPYSPRTRGRVGGDGMTLAELCEAALRWSDNTAANLLLDSFGGPQQLTAFARSLGDSVTRLDRIEPHLNDATPGDPRDTTTPAAMLKNVQALVLGEALSAASRGQLTAWLIGNTTGDKRLRAGLPAGWRCGDKTGSGKHGTANDVGVIWPPERPPIVVAAYLTGASASMERRNAVLAAVARAVVKIVG